MIEKLLPFIVVIKAVAVVAILVATLAAGMQVMAWRKDAEIAELKADTANDKAIQSEAALKELADATKIIHDAAAGATVNIAALGLKLDALQKAFKNARPLPADCRPDDFRLKHLADSVDAVKAAVAGAEKNK